MDKVVYADVDKSVPVYNLMESFEEETNGPSVIKATSVRIRLHSEANSQMDEHIRDPDLISKGPI
jgi:hypothetical protein